MIVLKKLSYLLFFAIISFTACTPEVETFDSDLLYGRWDIVSAQRDGHPTETLTNTFFEFENGGMLTTNFNLEGNEVSGKFEIEGMNITQKGSADINYSVAKLEEGKLVLLTKLMNYEFTLNLVKED